MEERTSQSQNGACFAYKAVDMLASGEGAQSCLETTWKAPHTWTKAHSAAHCAVAPELGLAASEAS